MSIIKEARSLAGLSQIELASRAKIQPGQLNRIERGINPNQATANKIAAALQSDVRQLFPDFDQLRKY